LPLNQILFGSIAMVDDLPLRNDSNNRDNKYRSI